MKIEGREEGAEGRESRARERSPLLTFGGLVGSKVKFRDRKTR